MIASIRSRPDIVTSFMEKIRKHPTYRNATHTQSVLTITSNVVYGKATGNTPDGRRKGEPFGPGANPMHGRDSHGWLASCLSVAKLPYKDAQDGISYTVSVAPQKAHLSEDQLVDEAVKAFDVYFERGGFHMNLNVIDKETLEDAMKNPDKYPQLTIRVSGYAVNFVRLTPRAAERCDQPHFPRPNLAGGPRCRPCSRLNPEVVMTCGSGFRPTPRMKSNIKDEEGSFGYCHSYETSSRYDGPGLRVVLFVSGCLLRCTYCHNPDTWHLKDGTYVSVDHVLRPPRRLCARDSHPGRRSDDFGRRAHGAACIHPKNIRRAPRRWACTRRSRRRDFWAIVPTIRICRRSTSFCSTSRARIRTPIAE